VVVGSLNKDTFYNFCRKGCVSQVPLSVRQPSAPCPGGGSSQGPRNS